MDEKEGCSSLTTPHCPAEVIPTMFVCVSFMHTLRSVSTPPTAGSQRHIGSPPVMAVLPGIKKNVTYAAMPCGSDLAGTDTAVTRWAVRSGE